MKSMAALRVPDRPCGAKHDASAHADASIRCHISSVVRMPASAGCAVSRGGQAMILTSP
jgi:hypothetical protein